MTLGHSSQPDGEKPEGGKPENPEKNPQSRVENQQKLVAMLDIISSSKMSICMMF